MHYGGDIDSLTLEIDRIASSRAQTMRPTTTGEIDAKSVTKLSKQRAVVESYVDKPTRAPDQMRPRAPMASRRGAVESASGSAAAKADSSASVVPPPDNTRSFDRTTALRSAGASVKLLSRARSSDTLAKVILGW